MGEGQALGAALPPRGLRPRGRDPDEGPKGKLTRGGEDGASTAAHEPRIRELPARRKGADVIDAEGWVHPLLRDRQVPAPLPVHDPFPPDDDTEDVPDMELRVAKAELEKLRRAPPPPPPPPRPPTDDELRAEGPQFGHIAHALAYYNRHYRRLGRPVLSIAGSSKSAIRSAIVGNEPWQIKAHYFERYYPVYLRDELADEERRGAGRRR